MVIKIRLIITAIISLFLLGSYVPVFAGGCEIVSYDVSEVKDKHISCSGKVSYTEHQCVDFTIRSLSSVGHQVKDFNIKAIYEDRTYEKRKILPANSDPDTVLIGAGERYSSKICFRIRPGIIGVECSLK